ncbi:glycosyltransferase [uncultured Phascolarctobacterium sp.]|uniref:glycosyltransferase n=1 Tax=uncultured Phascolarctobacterium sp. TaxID=512296 RepID=UPI00262451AC|nr:glycosyltransferase [uncultured Phascolarctobacterium sp.]
MKILLANFTKMVNDSGGLAKVTSAFANEMAARGHDVSILYSDERHGEFFYPVKEAVRCYNLKDNTDGSNIKFPLYLKAAREMLRAVGKRPARTVNSWFEEHYLLDNVKYYLDIIKPDIIISYQPAASKLLLCDAGTDIPVITMSHGDPEDYFHIYPVKEIPALTKSAICQVLMPSFEEHIKNHLPNTKTITIGNAIPQFGFSADLVADKKQYKVIFVGRLTKNHKRPHLLVQAFTKLAAKYPNWILELWGAKDRATYYKELEHMISSANLSDRIFIKGATDKVPEKLREADIFAFPSAFEGFGMALAEGMSVGLPSVGYKNCPAVNELIKDGETGFLCDDGVEPLAQVLDKLMGDRELRVQMGKAAKADMAQFAPEKIWDQWEELMENVIKGK